MKALGMGLIILLIGLILGTYASYVSYAWTKPYDELIELEVEDLKKMYDELHTAATVGLVGTIISVIGVAIFVVEFRASVKPESKVEKAQ